MRALTVEPGHPDSLALRDVHQPEPGANELLVKTLVIGLCGTDREIVEGSHGAAPEGQRHLILGHESLGEVLQAPPGSSFRPGDLVVGIVRRPDPLPCDSCAAGEWDMCQNGRYTERGIQGEHGYGSERFVLHERFAIQVAPELRETGVLLEPASVVAKAWEQIDRVAARLVAYRPRRALITGAGPIGLLAALLAVERGYDVSVLDRATDGIKPQLVRSLGARYCTGLEQLPAAPEVVVESTGAGAVILEVIRKSSRNGIVCLTGLSTGAHRVELSSDKFNNSLVLENDVVLGSVNANRRHYEAAVEALQRAPEGWLKSLLTRRVPIERFAEAFENEPGDVKVTLHWA